MFDLLLDKLFPRNLTCDICGVETFGNNLCKSCFKDMRFNDGVTCPVCGRKTVRPEICLDCKYEPPKFTLGVSALVYCDNSAVLVHKFKNGSGYLKEYFADLMTGKIAQFPNCDALVFTPMSKSDVRKRGYNQAKLLASAISKRTGIPILENALEKVKSTKQQKTLTRKEREDNLRGCFKVHKNEVNGKKIILVDDVLTTGATANEICSVLLSCGASAVYLVTAASVEYKAEN